jgi:hypothetical protein
MFSFEYLKRCCDICGQQTAMRYLVERVCLPNRVGALWLCLVCRRCYAVTL